MEKKNNCYFDLSTLLMKGDLNIRQVAESDSSLTIGKFFEMLAEFIDMAPDALIALRKFAEINENMRDRRTIETIISSLKQLGSNKCLPELYALSNARSKGDSRLAAFHAKAIMDDFNSFYLQIISAKTDALPNGARDEQSSLKELIQFLDNEEADRKKMAPAVDDSPKELIQFLDNEEANRKMMVLAVDDSPAILTAVETVLSKTYKVFKLPKPEMLESILAQVTPDLFLLDYRMPVLSGFDLIPIIRSFEKHKDTPIIFLTSERSVDHVSAAMTLGACDFIVKPFQADMLCQKVAKHIVRKKKF